MSKQAPIVSRFGARYGRTVRKRLGQIESELRKAHRCPSCDSMTVKRLGVGIWKCTKCKFTFSGGAYTPSTSHAEVAKRNIRKE